MKKLAAMLCLSTLATGAFAQGLVVMNNQPGTLITASTGAGGAQTSITGTAGSAYYFGLLYSTTAGGPFTFSGTYSTNIAAAGRINGGSNLGVAVNGWAPGATMFFEIAGWSSSLGATFNNTWTKADGSVNAAAFTTAGFFGVSSIASGIAGGGPQSLPAQQAFGSSGVSGFNLNAVGVPEPGTMALAGLGAAALLIFRRRK